MKPARKLEYARWIVSGAIFGTAIFGVFLNGSGVDLAGIDHHTVGALVGGIATAFVVKAAHLV